MLFSTVPGVPSSYLLAIHEWRGFPSLRSGCGLSTDGTCVDGWCQCACWRVGSTCSTVLSYNTLTYSPTGSVTGSTVNSPSYFGQVTFLSLFRTSLPTDVLFILLELHNLDFVSLNLTAVRGAVLRVYDSRWRGLPGVRHVWLQHELPDLLVVPERVPQPAAQQPQRGASQQGRPHMRGNLCAHSHGTIALTFAFLSLSHCSGEQRLSHSLVFTTG